MSDKPPSSAYYALPPRRQSFPAPPIPANPPRPYPPAIASAADIWESAAPSCLPSPSHKTPPETSTTPPWTIRDHIRPSELEPRDKATQREIERGAPSNRANC